MSAWGSQSSIPPSCIHKYATGCLQLSSSVCCFCIQQYSNTPTGQDSLYSESSPVVGAEYCSKCQEYWIRDFLANRPAALDAIGSLSEVPSGSFNASNSTPHLTATSNSSTTYLGRSLRRKARREAFQSLIRDLQAIREGLAQIIVSFRAFSEDISTAQSAYQTVRAPSERVHMEQMNTNAPGSMMENGRALSESSLFSRPDFASQRAYESQVNSLFTPFGNVTSSSQTSNPSPAAPSYSFPGSSNAASTMMQQDPEFVNDWRRHFAAYYQRRAASNATGSQHAHPETPLQNREPTPSHALSQRYNFFPAGTGHSSIRTTSGGNPHRRTGSNSPYPLMSFLEQHGSARREYHHHRRTRRHGHRNPSTPKSLDNMEDGRPEAKEASELTIRLDCKICLTQLVDTVIMPCGHAALCRWCADMHIPSSELDPTRPGEHAKCPICRANVERKHRIYLA